MLKVIGHPLRLRIIELLDNEDSLHVNQIADLLDIEQSLTSHHLNRLRLNGIVECLRDGKHVQYSLKRLEAGAILRMLRGQETR
jgi:DNA-binding transcriptional ArsR family regulator